MALRSISTKTLWSSEFIEWALLLETQNLVNLRCLDMGFIPYNQPMNKVKLWGPPRYPNLYKSVFSYNQG